MKKLTGPIIWFFVRTNSVVIDTTHGLTYFPHITMQDKTASSETTAKLGAVNTDNALMIPPRITKTIRAFVDHPSERNTTGTEDWDTIRKVYGNSKSSDFTLNVDINWQQNSGQGNQYNRITISNRKQYTDCRVLRCHSGAIQVP